MPSSSTISLWRIIHPMTKIRTKTADEMCRQNRVISLLFAIIDLNWNRQWRIKMRWMIKICILSYSSVFLPVISNREITVGSPVPKVNCMRRLQEPHWSARAVPYASMDLHNLLIEIQFKLVNIQCNYVFLSYFRRWKNAQLIKSSLK